MGIVLGDFCGADWRRVGDFRTRLELALIPKLMYMKGLNNKGRKLAQLEVTRPSLINTTLV